MSNNFLAGLSFAMTIVRLPETTFNLQATSLPGLNANPIMRPTPFISTPIPGEHMDFTPLSVTFLVDENMENYLEIFDWMMALYFPDNFDQYAGLSNIPGTTNAVTSDLTLDILTSARNRNKSIIFEDAFPISLGELTMSYQTPDVEYLSCTANFAFRKFRFI